MNLPSSLSGPILHTRPSEIIELFIGNHFIHTSIHLTPYEIYSYVLDVSINVRTNLYVGYVVYQVFQFSLIIRFRAYENVTPGTVIIMISECIHYHRYDCCIGRAIHEHSIYDYQDKKTNAKVSLQTIWKDSIL